MDATPARTTNERYCALDSLRAAMMLLGVYIHAIAPFSTIPDVWWYQDRTAGVAFDVQLLVIHSFRMPVFFAMAGFFGALLLERRGLAAFALNRTRRILLPLLACLILLVPLLKGLQLAQRLLANTGTVRTPDFLTWYPRMLADFNAGPYWFLLYLIYFYVLALVLRPLVRTALAGRPAAWAARAFDALAGSARGPYVLALTSVPGLLGVPAGVFPAPQGFVPEVRILVVYAPFVIFGWALFHRRRCLGRFAPGAWTHLGLGVLSMAIMIAACSIQLSQPARAPEALLVTVVAGSWCVWEMLFALLGLFQRYLSKPSRGWRYASDSSYWVYLAHSPVLLAVQLFVFRSPWPGSAKLLVALLVAIPTLFASYHWVVRPTWLGAWLNGRRHAAAPASASIASAIGLTGTTTTP